MSNQLIKKLSEDMAYAILENKEIKSVVQGVLVFSSCVDGGMIVTSGDPLHIKCSQGEFDIPLNGRSMFEALVEALVEAFEKTYYAPLLSK